jgi:hypothetical protein
MGMSPTVTGAVTRHAVAKDAVTKHDSVVPCTFNGVPETGADTLYGVTPGANISISCSGFFADEEIVAFEASPLAIVSGNTDDVDEADAQFYFADDSGDLNVTFTVPDPFTAADPAAECPPPAAQSADGPCGLIVGDDYGNLGAVSLVYTSPPVTKSAGSSGYDLVGRDGGVFVFPGSGSFFGSLPGLGVHVSNIVGMVPTANDGGYFLVGSDGGVFAFGNAPFLGSLPGQHVHINDVVGIVPTSNDEGYFLVGKDGGVFTFGNAPFLGSLPGRGIHVDNIIGIAADASGQGYVLIASTGQVYTFGNVPNIGSATGNYSPVSAIEATADGGGYWVVFQNGSVYTFGDAGFFGSLPGLHVTPARPVIGLVPTADGGGYWLIGADGGIFSFGDAPFVGSLPGLHVSVNDIVGAVATTI